MHFSLNYLLYFAFSFGGIFITYHLNHTLKQGSVRSSALASLVVGLIFYLVPNMFEQDLQTGLPLIFIGASFIGMSNTRYFGRITQIFFAAILFSLLSFLSVNLFIGYGGKLGLMANISVVITIATFALLKNRPNSESKMENKRLT